MSRDVSTVWELWNKPEHMKNWQFASPDWECPHAENDLRVGGRLLVRMAAKDKSASFDVIATYTAVEEKKLIEYAMSDERKVSIRFSEEAGATRITETFEMESENPEELQRSGWQAILDNFKKYAEGFNG